MSAKETVEKYYTAFNDQDWATMLELLDSNVEHEINQGNVEVGREKFAKFLSVMDEHYSERVAELVVLSDESKKSNRVAAEFFIEGVYKKTQEGLPAAKNQKYRLRVGAFFEVKGERIVRVTNYYNLPLWCELVSK